MAKFNRTTTRTAVASPIQTEPTATGMTYEGAPGYARDAKSELFLLAVVNMVGEQTFYESAGDRDNRYAALVRQVAVTDPGWMLGFLGWLRGEGNMRSASLVGAAEAVKARLDAAKTGEVPNGARNRQIIDAVLQRADEPGEMLAYWTSRYGRALPKPVKRGVADAVRRLYNERALLKYDTASRGYRFADVLELVHPTTGLVTHQTIEGIARDRGVDPAVVEERLRHVAESVRGSLPDDVYINLGTAEFMRTPLPSLTPGWRSRTVAGSLGMAQEDLIRALRGTRATSWQGDLFKHALDRRHNRDTEIPEALSVLRNNAQLRHVAAERPEALLSEHNLRAAGMTWEDALSLVGSKVDKAALWTAMVPSMGYMALLRNLRNFDEAGVADDVAATVAALLADPEQVAKSRQFPFRFLSAYRNAPSLRWGHALDKALTASLSNVPALSGRTLILVDVSGSMADRMSGRSELSRADAASVFGAALALRTDPTLVWFNDRSGRVDVPKGGSLLRLVEAIPKPNGGTYTAAAVARWYAGHDRVVIVTDEQAHYTGHGSVDAPVPAHVPVYTWNLAGYRMGHAPSGAGTRHTFGGLTDAAFRMVNLIESGKTGRWPWEEAPAP